eukprot:c3782_g1_i1.p2 GENE.c3782_g1_i1~~c3782_g1_i1.p2  ORF type:complete len:111 (+),score=20.87 c3782_g1_i1:142-474(+)
MTDSSYWKSYSSSSTWIDTGAERISTKSSRYRDSTGKDELTHQRSLGDTLCQRTIDHSSNPPAIVSSNMDDSKLAEFDKRWQEHDVVQKAGLDKPPAWFLEESQQHLPPA